MHRVDPTGRNWAAEIEYRHHGYVVKIDAVLSGGRNVYYDIFGPDDAHVGSARSLREAAEVIDEARRPNGVAASTGAVADAGTKPLLSRELAALFRDHPCNPGWEIHPQGGRDHDHAEPTTLWHEGKSYGSNDMVTMRCQKGHQWRTYLENIFAGHGCPVCSLEAGQRS